MPERFTLVDRQRGPRDSEQRTLPCSHSRNTTVTADRVYMPGMQENGAPIGLSNLAASSEKQRLNTASWVLFLGRIPPKFLFAAFQRVPATFIPNLRNVLMRPIGLFNDE